MKRIVIKIGSNVLTRADGTMDVTRVSSIVDQIVAVRRAGYQVIIVSSGAVACGRSCMKSRSSRTRRLDAVQQRQIYSAVGQIRLMNLYSRLFGDYGTVIGQVLTMKESFGTRREYLNQRSCMEVMLENDIIPIVNENDTVSVTELMFTDNDELSGLVASMMDAETLLILSNVDGIYSGSPKSSTSRLISRISPEDDISSYISSEKSGFGRGGMLTKSSIARKVADEGIRVIIANGCRADIIRDIVLAPENAVFTEFIPNQTHYSSVKKWIAHSTDFSKGRVSIDDSAAGTLTGRKAASVLMVGITDIQGDFEEGDIIGIYDSKGTEIALGRSSYNAEEARKMAGQHDCRPLIHYDYLYII